MYQRVVAWVRELKEIVKIDPKLEMYDGHKVLHVKKILVGVTKEIVKQK